MKRGRSVPLRTCAGCGAKRPKWELLRVIRLPGGEVRFDSDQRLQGRGAYFCPLKECIKRGLKRGKFAKALGKALPEELVEVLERASEIYAEICQKEGRKDEEVSCGGKG